jgi:unsaturated rhamnogalacturonyl hydrolase
LDQLIILKAMIVFVPFLLAVILSGNNEQEPVNNIFADKSPKNIGRLITADLLSRPEFMMYATEQCTAVHYAEACAGYGAAKLAGLLNDHATILKLSDRYARVIDENIPNTANHVDANVYGILPLELYLQNKNDRYLKQGIALADKTMGGSFTGWVNHPNPVLD